MTYITFQADDRSFTISENLLTNYPNSILTKVCIHRQSHPLCNLVKNMYIVDLDPDSFAIIISMLRGYSIIWEQLNPLLCNKVQFDAQRLDLTEIFIKQIGGDINGSVINENSSDSETLSALSIEQKEDEYKKNDDNDDNYDNDQNDQNDENDQNDQNDENEKDSKHDIMDSTSDPEDILPSYSVEESLSDSISSTDMLDEESLDENILADSDSLSDVEKMIQEGDIFVSEKIGLSEMMNLSKEEETKLRKELDEQARIFEDHVSSSFNTFIDTSILDSDKVTRVDIDNLVNSIQERLQGGDLMATINSISTDPHIMRLLKTKKSTRSKHIDTFSLSELMQDSYDEAETEFIDIV
jgi:hypothetical protein